MQCLFFTGIWFADITAVLLVCVFFAIPWTDFFFGPPSGPPRPAAVNELGRFPLRGVLDPPMVYEVAPAQGFFFQRKNPTPKQ